MFIHNVLRQSPQQIAEIAEQCVNIFKAVDSRQLSTEVKWGLILLAIKMPYAAMVDERIKSIFEQTLSILPKSSTMGKYPGMSEGFKRAFDA